MTADVPPERNAGPSLLTLALRVVRGELTEDQALEIVRTSSPAKDGEGSHEAAREK